MRRGEVWLINLEPTVGSEIKKTRREIARVKTILNEGRS